MLLIPVLGSCTLDALEAQPGSTRIAFGSCAHQNKEQPILDRVLEWSPSAFVYLGDNIYGDTRNMNKLREKYERSRSSRSSSGCGTERPSSPRGTITTTATTMPVASLR